MRKLLPFLVIIMTFFMGCAGRHGDENQTDYLREASYTVDNVKVIPGTDFDTIKDSLGEPDGYKEAASCYYDGMDKIYIYDGFEIRTCPKDGRDYIQDLCISSDTYSAYGNITVGSAVDDVVYVYGDDYTKTGSMYRYALDDGAYIYFFFLNDVVKYFGYAIDFSN